MRWTVGICVMMLAACSLADTPLVSFNDSGCKGGDSRPLTAGLVSQGGALLTKDSADLDGLTCFSWDATGATLKIDCINFRDGCGVTWSGDATVEDGNAVTLFAKDDCMRAACGSCIYDWSYEVKYVNPGRDVRLTLVKGGSCNPDGTVPFSATLPLSSMSSGVLCRYSGNGLWPDALSGSLHRPCRDSGDSSSDSTPCDEGLVCASTSDMNGDPVDLCLAACAADTDCPLDGLLKCEEGLCNLKETW